MARLSLQKGRKRKAQICYAGRGFMDGSIAAPKDCSCASTASASHDRITGSGSISFCGRGTIVAPGACCAASPRGKPKTNKNEHMQSCKQASNQTSKHAIIQASKQTIKQANTQSSKQSTQASYQTSNQASNHAIKHASKQANTQPTSQPTDNLRIHVALAFVDSRLQSRTNFLLSKWP